jgi:hypothetical protein
MENRRWQLQTPLILRIQCFGFFPPAARQNANRTKEKKPPFSIPEKSYVLQEEKQNPTQLKFCKKNSWMSRKITWKNSLLKL